MGCKMQLSSMSEEDVELPLERTWDRGMDRVDTQTPLCLGN